MSRISVDGRERVTQVFRTVNAQPNWVLRITLWVFGLVILLPILFLLLLALILATIVFGILAAVSWTISALRGDRRARDSRRENVRVIQRDS